MPKKINMLGQKIGKLMVIEYLGTIIRKNTTKKTDKYWKCLCDCGNYKEVPTSHLKTKNTKSCGCLIKENAQRNIKKAHEANRLPPGISGFNMAFNQYKNAAKSRKLPFELHETECMQLFKGNCYYCNSEPLNCTKRRNISISLLFYYNGIDRINNKEGYKSENVRSCCLICNWMKKDLTQEDFYNHIQKIMDNKKK